MSAAGWILIALGVLLVGGAIFGWQYTWRIAKSVYTDLLVRTSPEKWARTNSCPEDAEYSQMYNEALTWRAQYETRIREVSIVSDGFRLCGEFLDFGTRRTVILISGRAEGLDYSYYYAEPYRRSGCNILSIDIRAHGLSEGKYNGLGIKEYVDLQAWARFLCAQCHTDTVILHGICIGGAAALLAVTSQQAPACIRGIVADGLYTTFSRVCRQRMKTNHRPVFPVLLQLNLLTRHYSKVDMIADGPIHHIAEVRVPILMLHSREDISSLPEMAQALYDKCGSPDKRLVWLEKGAHSHLRSCNTAEYDHAVETFVQSLT